MYCNDCKVHIAGGGISCPICKGYDVLESMPSRREKKKSLGCTGWLYVIILLFAGLVVWSHLAESNPESAHKTSSWEDEYVDACRIYGAARQECATAGDYENCMKIKDTSKIDGGAICNPDGTVTRYGESSK